MVASDEVFAKIETRLTKVDKSNRQLNEQKTVRFQITDDSGSVLKTWFLDLINVTLVAADKPADSTWVVSDKNMVEIGNGSLNIKAAIDSGKLKVEGSTEFALLLAPFVSSL